MIVPSQAVKVVIATKPVDFRKGHDGLAAVVQKERDMLKAEALESGKPEAVIEKMIDGRMRKFYEEVVLLSQTFVIDGENTVEQALKNAEGDVGGAITLKGFVRYALGEGIEKVESNLAEEVAAELAKAEQK